MRINVKKGLKIPPRESEAVIWGTERKYPVYDVRTNVKESLKIPPRESVTVIWGRTGTYMESYYFKQIPPVLISGQ
jgi:hypothetical protein